MLSNRILWSARGKSLCAGGAGFVVNQPLRRSRNERLCRTRRKILSIMARPRSETTRELRARQHKRGDAVRDSVARRRASVLKSIRAAFGTGVFSTSDYFACVVPGAAAREVAIAREDLGRLWIEDLVERVSRLAWRVRAPVVAVVAAEQAASSGEAAPGATVSERYALWRAHAGVAKPVTILEGVGQIRRGDTVYE